MSSGFSHVPSASADASECRPYTIYEASQWGSPENFSTDLFVSKSNPFFFARAKTFSSIDCVPATKASIFARVAASIASARQAFPPRISGSSFRNARSEYDAYPLPTRFRDSNRFTFKNSAMNASRDSSGTMSVSSFPQTIRRLANFDSALRNSSRSFTE